MPIIKATYTVTVLAEADTELGGAAVFAYAGMATLLELMDSGDMIGCVHLSRTELVAPDRIKAELLAVGSDGEFFNTCDGEG